MNLLILSFYYQPDLSAGSFRTTALVQALLPLLPKGSHVEVITTLPNRYASYSTEAPTLEQKEGMTIHRISIPSHRSGMIDQAKAFLFFAKGVLSLVAGKHYDGVYATSSRLMTAVLGALVAKQQRTPLYLDIRDIFVDTINDMLPKYFIFFAKPLFSFMERLAMSRADHINLVSRGFADYFSSRYPDKSFSFYTNGIDDAFLHATPAQAASSPPPGDSIQVLYAGNMGEGQGLHTILPQLAKRLGDRVHFTVIGDGGRKDALQQAVVQEGVTTVFLRPPVSRDELLAAYLQADVLFLHLNNYGAMHKVLPSKIFEYAALGKPIWAGVGGYAAEFLRQEVTNVAVFAPCNVEEACQVFAGLSLQTTARQAFVDKYGRRHIATSMARQLLCLANPTNCHE